MIFDDVLEMINSSKNVAIFSHQNSDADAIGSSIAFKLFLESLGKNARIFIQKPIHKNYSFLGVNEHVNAGISRNFDLAIALDCPSPARFGIYQKKFYTIKNSIAFDHHPDFANFAKINYCDEKASSACLLVYRFLKHINFKLTSDIALNLYAGMSTDTGRFVHSNLTSELFNAVADLYSTNFDYIKANYYLFLRTSTNEVELFKHALNNINYYENNKIAIARIDEKDLIETGTKCNDTYKIIDYLCNIDGVEIACLLTQFDYNEYLVSIRSRHKNAQNIAKKFGGGGHIKASGCRMFTDGDRALNLLKKACEEELKS